MLSVASLAVLAVVAAALWKLFRGYFVKSPFDNIPGPARSSLLQGNLADLFNRHAWDFHDNIRETYGPVIKFHTAFGGKGLYVFDPKALNNIVIKDQLIFEEPRWFIQWNLLTLGPGLLSTLGDHHRKQRKLLNPVFSIAHMRHMTPIFYHVIHKLQHAVEKQVGNSVTEVNILDWMTRTALELVGQGGLGYSFDPLLEVKRNVFGDALKEFLPVTFALQYWRMVWPHVSPFVPGPLRPLLAKMLPVSEMRKMKSIVEAMDKQANLIFRSKQAALEKGDDATILQLGEGKDIISILMRANMAASSEDKLPEDELIGQMATLVFAATDTTSNALARIFHLLAEHQDVQDKMRAEILEASPDGEDIPYDQIVELPYMDAVCRETLRLYPPVTMLSRETRQDVVLPLSEPIHGEDGSLIHEIPVPKDTMVIIGIRACNRNKAVWGDDAQEWKPERWLAPLPEEVGKAHVPGVYANLMTFFGGGRSCIGFKFSQLEMKIVLAIILRTFKVTLSSKEVYWNVAGVNYPTVGKDGSRAEMPLMLERIKA